MDSSKNLPFIDSLSNSTYRLSAALLENEKLWNFNINLLYTFTLPCPCVAHSKICTCVQAWKPIVPMYYQGWEEAPTVFF